MKNRAPPLKDRATSQEGQKQACPCTSVRPSSVPMLHRMSRLCGDYCRAEPRSQAIGSQWLRPGNVRDKVLSRSHRGAESTAPTVMETTEEGGMGAQMPSQVPTEGTDGLGNRITQKGLLLTGRAQTTRGHSAYT